MSHDLGKSTTSESMFAEALCEEALEISIVGAEGVPDGSIVSVRAGSMRRQRMLSQCREPFVFCAKGRNTCPLQVDVLTPLATSGPLEGVQPGEHKLELKRHEGGSLAGPSTPGDRLSLVVNVSGSSSSRPPTKQSSETLQRYLEEHNLMSKLTIAMKRLFRQLPSDPLKFLSEELDSIRPGNASKRQYSQTKVDNLHVLPLCVEKNDPELFTRLLDFGSGEIGFYSLWTDKAGKLNVKSNKRKAPFFEHYVEPNHVDDFCNALLEEFDLEELVNSQPEAQSNELSFFCGATGLHRELLLNDNHCEESAQAFLHEVEAQLVEKLGIPSAKLYLFVPSGIIEAQLELRATEWLIGQTNLLDIEGSQEAASCAYAILKEALHKIERDCSGELTNDKVFQRLTESHEDKAHRASVLSAMPLLLESVKSHGDAGGSDELYASFLKSIEGSRSLQTMVQTAAFAGTLSVGGGSSQMAMMGTGGADEALQLFSVPAGNRVPLVEGMFSKPVLPEERDHWRSRIRSELLHANIPRSTRGFFVGISACYYAALSADMTDRVVSKQVVVQALEAKLKLLPADDQRSIANLTLVSELLDWVFDDEACFLFKRNWQFDDREYVSTWTLGLYTHQCECIGKNPRSTARRIARSRLAPPVCMSTLLEDGNGVDALLEVPFVAWPLVASNLLDMGSGEIGIYQFEADLASKSVSSKINTKLAKPIYDAFVKDGLVEEFSETMIKEFGLSAKSLRADSVEVVAGGATGLHREILLNEPEKRDQMLEFFSKVELEMAKRLSRRVALRIFVPSGELEAQYELRAVVWLISQPDVDIGESESPNWMVEFCWGKLSHGSNALDTTDAQLLMKDVLVTDLADACEKADQDHNRIIRKDEFIVATKHDAMLQALVRRTAFAGTVSAGGGSSQLSLTSTSVASLGLAQLYSMPVGNRVPIVTGMFSNPAATHDERALWVERIHQGLQHSGFPKGLTGLFVGISAMYYAAKKSGIADRYVGKQEAVHALADALTKVKDTDHRDLANLTLAKELLNYAFSDRSCFLFKRNWKCHGNTHVAGWTLGWYVTQFEGDAAVRERSICNMQRIARGHRVRTRAPEEFNRVREEAQKLRHSESMPA